MPISEFEQSISRNAPVYYLRYRGTDGTADVIVQTFGTTWGFTIWREDACLHGEKDWNWTKDEAVGRAMARLKEMCGEHV